MGRGINSGSIQIRPDNAQNQTESWRVCPKRRMNNIFSKAKSNGSSAFYAGPVRRGVRPPCESPLHEERDADDVPNLDSE